MNWKIRLVKYTPLIIAAAMFALSFAGVSLGEMRYPYGPAGGSGGFARCLRRL